METYQIATTIGFSLASIVATWFFARFYAFRRRLMVTLVSSLNIVDLSKVSREKIDIRYGDESLENLWILRFVLRNSGTVDMTSSMVRTPLKLGFGSNVSILDVELTFSTPGTELQISCDQESVTVAPEFFPRKSTAAFQVFANEKAGERFEAGRVRVIEGVIENTETRLEDLRDGVVVGASLRVEKLVTKNRKTVRNIYWALTAILFCMGLGLLVFPDLASLGEDLKLPNFGSVTGLLFIVSGLLLFPLSLTLHRLIRFREFFERESGDTDGE